jgi:hypothetical protein
MQEFPKPPLATLGPSAMVTLGVRFALQGIGNLAFYRWVPREWRRWFPALPERTRGCRWLAPPRAWREEFRAPPSVLGGVASAGLELLHPRRAGRRAEQMGRKGTSHPRWLGGGNLGLRLNNLGLVGSWDCAGVHAPATACPPLSAPFAAARSVLRDAAFPAQAGAPAHRQLGARGLWNTRRWGATVLSMRHGGCYVKKVAQRTWAAFQTRLAFPVATFPLRVPWQGRKPEAQGFVHLSLAEFSL